MARFYNIVGNLVEDPKTKDVEGKSVTEFTIAHNPERYDPGTKRHVRTGDTEYYEVSAWGKLGEHVASSLKKGDRATVGGLLTESTYDRADGRTGTNRSISAREVGASLQFVDVSIGSRAAALTPPF